MMFKVANKSLRVILALSLVFSNDTFARSKQVTKEEERKLLQALAELAIEGQEPELQSPLAEASREMYLRQDLENILKSETKIIVEKQYHVKVAPNVTTINGANTKFLNLAKRVALEQSLSSLFFYSVISYQQNPFLSRLSFGSQELLSKQYTGALNVLKVWESHLSEARRYRDVLLNSSVDTIIKKGFEVGALAEHSDTLKGQLAEVDALLPETKDLERSDLLKKKEELTSQIFALDIEVDQRISQDPLFLSLTLPIIPANQSQPIPLYVYLRELIPSQSCWEF